MNWDNAYILIPPGNSVDCGYCKGKGTSVNTASAFCQAMTPQMYQCMADSGASRSGGYIYRPDHQNTCCPQITIRLDPKKFKVSKSQKKKLKKLRKFVGAPLVAFNGSREDVEKVSVALGVDLNLKEREVLKMWDSGTPFSPFTLGTIAGDHGVFRMVLSPQEASDEVWEVFKAYEEKVHKAEDGDKKDLPTREGMTRFICEQVQKQGMRSIPPPSKLPPPSLLSGTPLGKKLSAATGVRSPHKIHSPYEAFYGVPEPTETPNVPPTGFGPMHLQYWWEEGGESSDRERGTFTLQQRKGSKLLGVSVIDVLPSCVSSNYFIRSVEPEHVALSLGTISALTELVLSSLIRKWCPDSPFFLYLGYYVPTCAKMRYKADFSPSEILCPTTGQWYPFSQLTAAIDAGEASGERVMDFSEVVHAEPVGPPSLYQMFQPRDVDAMNAHMVPPKGLEHLGILKFYQYLLGELGIVEGLSPHAHCVVCSRSNPRTWKAALQNFLLEQSESIGGSCVHMMMSTGSPQLCGSEDEGESD